MYKVSLLVPPESHRSKMSSTVCSRWKTSFLLWSSSFLETRARLNYIHYLGAIKPGNRWQMDKSSKGKRSSCSFVAVSQFGGIFSNFGLGLTLIVSKLWLSNQSAAQEDAFVTEFDQCFSLEGLQLVLSDSISAFRAPLSHHATQWRRDATQYKRTRVA